MDLLRAALRLTEAIPDTAAYADERDFCWATLARAAIEVGDAELFRRAFPEVRGISTAARLRDDAVGQMPAVRPEILEDILERFEHWDSQLFRGQLSGLARPVAEDFGLLPAAALAPRITDPFARVCWLDDLSDVTEDPVLQRSFLMEAWEAAKEVESDHDYALRHVVAGFLRHGMPAEAEAALDGGLAVHMHLDLLDSLAAAYLEAGQVVDARRVEGERRSVANENPEVAPESQVLADVARMLSEDPPFGDPSPRTQRESVDSDIARGRYGEALRALKEEFPTRAGAASLALPPNELRDLLTFQAEAVLSYHRNDLKVEFLVDLAVAAGDRAVALPGPVSALLSSGRFLAVEPPSVPSAWSRDPSTMALEEFVAFLFERPVHRTPEEERFMMRHSDDDPWRSRRTEAASSSSTTELFERFGEIAPRYSVRAGQSGRSAYLMCSPYSCLPVLRPRSVSRSRPPPPASARGVRVFYADYCRAAVMSPRATCDAFYLFWDEARRSRPAVESTVKPVILEAVTRVLDIDSPACQMAAIHGLDDLRPFPGVREVVQAFLDRHGTTLSPEVERYAHGCLERAAE